MEPAHTLTRRLARFDIFAGRTREISWPPTYWHVYGIGLRACVRGRGLLPTHLIIQAAIQAVLTAVGKRFLTASFPTLHVTYRTFV